MKSIIVEREILSKLFSIHLIFIRKTDFGLEIGNISNSIMSKVKRNAFVNDGQITFLGYLIKDDGDILVPVGIGEKSTVNWMKIDLSKEEAELNLAE